MKVELRVCMQDGRLLALANSGSGVAHSKEAVPNSAGILTGCCNKLGLCAYNPSKMRPTSICLLTWKTASCSPGWDAGMSSVKPGETSSKELKIRCLTPACTICQGLQSCWVLPFATGKRTIAVQFAGRSCAIQFVEPAQTLF